MTIGQRTLMKLVDELGDINAQIAALQEQAEAIKERLKAEGAGQYRGKDFVVIVKSCERTTVSWAKVAEEMHPAPELVAKFAKTSTVTTAEVKPLAN